MKQVALEELILFIQKTIANETHLAINELDIDASMGAFGLDSITSIYVLEQLENHFHLELSPLLFWDYPTIRNFSTHLHSMLQKRDG